MADLLILMKADVVRRLPFSMCNYHFAAFFPDEITEIVRANFLPPELYPLHFFRKAFMRARGKSHYAAFEGADGKGMPQRVKAFVQIFCEVTSNRCYTKFIPTA